MVELSFDKAAALALNCHALGVKRNLAAIAQAVKEAVDQGKNALFCGELCVSGAECDDMFLSPAFISMVKAEVEAFAQDLPPDFIVGLGMPAVMSPDSFEDPQAFAESIAVGSDEDEDEGVSHGSEGPLASAYVLVSRDGIEFCAPSKLQPESSRIDNSMRYFYQAYEFPGFSLTHGYVATIGNKKILIAFGDVNFFASEMMQEYVNSHKDEFAYIVAPELYTYEVDAPQKHEQQALTLSAILDLPLIKVNNLGCEAGGKLYDGQCLMIKDNEVVSRSVLFSFRPYEITDIKTGSEPALEQYDEMLKAVAIGLWDWMRKTYSKGYALSMSGGADSALCATCFALSQVYAIKHLGVEKYVSELKNLGVKFDYDAFTEEVVSYAGLGPYLSATNSIIMDQVIDAVKKHIMPQVLYCAYQGSDYSGSVTETAARQMSECLGATFKKWSISSSVKNYIETVQGALGYELSWESDDLALQNIQARSRLPSIWLLANHKGFLLMATSNLSEAAVGYCTMDGDTAGGVSPIAGIGKSNILKINRYITAQGIALDGFDQRFKVPAMSFIVAQAPTAELRPGGEQTDEKDLMPYPLLDTIRQLFALKRLMPAQIIDELIAGKDEKYKAVTTDLNLTDADITRFVNRFFALFRRNQWKRERFATGFHIEKDDCSPSSFMRFPVLSDSLLD